MSSKASGQRRSTPQKRGTSCWRCLIIVALLAGIGIGIWYALGHPKPKNIKIPNLGDLTNVLGNLTDFIQGFNNDPFLSNNSTSAWDNGNSNNGLSLTLYNALDPKWYPYFIKAVNQWDNGTPDTLTLSTQNVSVDHTCSRVNGILKVCNGNFGDTGWLGINELITTTATNIILSSVAKMNEYYLANANEAQKQYTMCHEMGHGFGLPHTDENFYNPDLGNCLDYTIHPEVNMQPAAMNFNRLKTLYGVVPASSSGNRDLETFVSNVHIPGRLTEVEEAEYQAAIDELEFDIVPNRGLMKIHDGASSEDGKPGWRLLQAHPHGHSSRYTRRLGHDFVLQVIVMHPVDHDM